jgi:hypothetical protein
MVVEKFKINYNTQKYKPMPNHKLTLLVPAEYMYSAASHASRPDGVLVLRDFQKVVK